MPDRFLKAGVIVNTHGVRGDVRVKPLSDSPEFLLDFDTIYIDSKPVKVEKSSCHKGLVLMHLEGVSDMNAAEMLKGTEIFIDREDAELEDGQFFLEDTIGLTAIDDSTGEELGTVEGIITLPAGNVLEIQGKREILVPAIGEFVKELDFENGRIYIELIEGM